MTTEPWTATLCIVVVLAVAGCTDDSADTGERPRSTDTTATTSDVFNLDEVSAELGASFDLCAHAYRYSDVQAQVRTDMDAPASLGGSGEHATDPARQAMRWHMSRIMQLADEAMPQFQAPVDAVLQEYEKGTFDSLDDALDKVRSECAEVLSMD